jgi:hypothetical protein
MTKYYTCLGTAIILLALIPNAEARFREKSPAADWRTFEVPDFGTSIQYPASIFTPAASLKWVSDSGLSALMDVLSYPFTLVPTKPAIPPELI